MSYGSKGGIMGRPATSENAKQIRQRARRKLRKLSPEEQTALWGKDLQHWDLEELARGRPRDKNGQWKGPAPGFLSRQMHEEIIARFETIVREEMNGHTVDALKLLGKVLNDEKVDNKGRPLVPASTKVDVAKFLIEHIIGKPKQRVESDISVKLQGILGHAIANPVLDAADGTYQLASNYLAMPTYEETNDDDA